jgi:NAD-dependent deacetylase
MNDNDTVDTKIKRAAELIENSRHTTVFTGAGISVESGIPPFRGENGLWNKYDPALGDIGYFQAHPAQSWGFIKEVFYEGFGQCQPNDAHLRVAELEQMGYVKAVITQNVDNLHHEAGSKNVFEFHGTIRTLSCSMCKTQYQAKEVSLDTVPPRCPVCMGIMRPDFVFFGEGIPKQASLPSFYEAQVADVFLVIGTTGEVLPACQIPVQAKQNGAKVIEINLDPSTFTFGTTDIFLQGKATEIMNRLVEEIKRQRTEDRGQKTDDR